MVIATAANKKNLSSDLRDGATLAANVAIEPAPHAPLILLLSRVASN